MLNTKFLLKENLPPPMLNIITSNDIIYRSARCGSLEIINHILKDGVTDYNGIMINAAFGGHEDIVRLMIDKGADNFNDAIYWTIQKGHEKLTYLMLELSIIGFKYPIKKWIDKCTNNISMVYHISNREARRIFILEIQKSIIIRKINNYAVELQSLLLILSWPKQISECYWERISPGTDETCSAWESLYLLKLWDKLNILEEFTELMFLNNKKIYITNRGIKRDKHNIIIYRKGLPSLIIGN